VVDAVLLEETAEGVTFEGGCFKIDFDNHPDLFKRLSMVELTVNVDTGAIAFWYDAEPEHKNEELLEKFRRSLDKENLTTLRNAFTRGREAVDEERWRSADWSDLSDETMVPWFEAFPGGEDTVFEYGGKRYEVIDHYCIEPGCPCREVMVAFAEITEGEEKPAVVEVGALRLDIRRWRVREKIPRRLSEETILELWKVCRREIPDINEKLAARFKRMRRFGAVVLGPQPAAAEEESGEDAPPVGRNDPCPCGSGKKYKKCCG
jgi:hypothetical protein